MLQKLFQYRDPKFSKVSGLHYNQCSWPCRWISHCNFHLIVGERRDEL